MTGLQRYSAADLPQIMEKIARNSIGLDNYFEDFFKSQVPSSNYPPFNLVQLNNHESRLEVALAGFRKMKLKSIQSLENYLSKASKKIRKQMESIHTGGWHNVHSNALGHSQMIQKFDRSFLKTDSYPSNWER